MTTKTMVALLGVVVVLSAIAYGISTLSNSGLGWTACTQEAKICPDGSAVGRTGPNCEFAECPAPVVSNTVSFTATPQSGSAPLTVRFSSSLTEPERYTINFGDGAGSKYDMCAESYPYQCSLEHVYRSPGTYTAQLFESLCPPNAEGCLAPDQIAASLTIEVR